MKEIEVKILEIDPEKIISKLQAIGAKKVFDEKIITFVYDTPDSKLDRQKILLRVRKEGNKCILGFKARTNQKSDMKVREEVEVDVNNFDNLNIILRKVGFHQKRSSEKHRISYSLGRIRFEIDSYHIIPPILEIEAPTEEEVEKGVHLMGYSMKDANKESYKDLLKHYKLKE